MDTDNVDLAPSKSCVTIQLRLGEASNCCVQARYTPRDDTTGTHIYGRVISGKSSQLFITVSEKGQLLRCSHGRRSVACILIK